MSLKEFFCVVAVEDNFRGTIGEYFFKFFDAACVAGRWCRNCYDTGEDTADGAFYEIKATAVEEKGAFSVPYVFR